ncbi:MAG: caspase family protein [Betaproteobacteria bacterium]|nr:caspase family protein [Betaproteobacteria bacterium]
MDQLQGWFAGGTDGRGSGVKIEFWGGEPFVYWSKMDAPSGTILAYSTAPGKVAADGGCGERNSPFTKHLIRAMQQTNQPIEEVFKEVRLNVGKETNGPQVPWESTSLTGFFTFRKGR